MIFISSKKVEFDAKRYLLKAYEAGRASTRAVADDPTLSTQEKLMRISENNPDLRAIVTSKLPEHKKIKLIKELLRKTKRERKEKQDDYASLLERGAEIETKMKGLNAAFDTLSRPFRVEHPQSSRLHELFDRKLLFIVDEVSDDKEGIRDFLVQMKEGAPQPLVVQHDWAQAFSGAHDYEGAEFRLPYPMTAFEFQTHGDRFIIVACEDAAHRPVGMIFYRYDDTWMNITSVMELDQPVTASAELTKAAEALNALLLQVKAVCVALDAEVVETEVVRAPPALNRARQKRGKVPLPDFRVVDLSKRYRTAGARSEAAEPGTRKRLHFRRGHWRHYATHRTWIKWMLVGNPDLGFIDKEYRA